jgi:hypothetical protein
MTIYVKSKSYQQALRFAELANKGEFIEMNEMIRKSGASKNTITKWLVKAKEAGILKIRYEKKTTNDKNRNYRIVRVAYYKFDEKIDVSIIEPDSRYMIESREKAQATKLQGKLSTNEMKKYLEKVKEIRRNELIDYAADLNYQGSCKQLIRMAEEMGVRVIC